MTTKSADANDVLKALKHILKLPDVPIKSLQLNLDVEEVPTIMLEIEISLDEFGPTFEEAIFNLHKID